MGINYVFYDKEFFWSKCDGEVMLGGSIGEDEIGKERNSSHI